MSHNSMEKSPHFLNLSSSLQAFSLNPSIVTSRYLPAQPQLAEAVPGSEEDHPCIPYSTSH